MQALTWVFVVFGVLEVMNVAVLYGAPGSRKANGVGVFTAWEKSKADPEVHLLVRYLVYWVAGVKVIFLALLAVIVVTGTEQHQDRGGCCAGRLGRGVLLAAVPAGPPRRRRPGRCAPPATPGPWAS